MCQFLNIVAALAGILWKKFNVSRNQICPVHNVAELPSGQYQSRRFRPRPAVLALVQAAVVLPEDSYWAA